VSNNLIEEEQGHLEKVKRRIEEEIETRKRELREIPKRYTNVLQGDAYLVEGLMSNAYSRLLTLENAKNSPYFGRIDFKDDEKNRALKLYVGKTAILDENQQLLTVDWRAPISSLYYDNGLGEVSYLSPRGEIKGYLSLKRQIIIKMGTLLNVFDTSVVTNDQLLQQYLNTHADNKMKNIIASIQKEQNKIIREDVKKNIIVQGVAGSGKTSVALHRIAYLIYYLNNDLNKGENVKTSQFVIIGPNNYFLDYVSGVLPDLDVNNIKQLTFINLAKSIIGENFSVVDSGEVLKQYLNAGRINNSSKIKNSLEFKNALQLYLVDFLSNLSNLDFKINDCLILPGENLRNIISSHKDSSVKELINEYISLLSRRIKDNYESYSEKITGKIKERAQALPQNSEERKNLFAEANKIDDSIKAGLGKELKNHIRLLNQSIIRIYYDFIENLSKYMDISAQDFEDIKKSTLKRLSKKEITSDDLSALLLISDFLDHKTSNKNIMHVVVDEAQDFGLFEFQMLKRIFPNATFSIFGDLNQSITSYRAINSWDEVKEKTFNGDCTINVLTQSYRTTEEIMEKANIISQILNNSSADEVIRHGEDVHFERVDEDHFLQNISDQLTELLQRGYTSIAIICKTEEEASQLNKELENRGTKIDNISSKDQKYNGGICTVSSYHSKGLEFDATILIDVNDENYNVNLDIDMKLLYVAFTRALHEVRVLYSGELLSIFKVFDRKFKR
jgi:DNA helicase-2/ATP-dependent DNA helicase PcrA